MRLADIVRAIPALRQPVGEQHRLLRHIHPNIPRAMPANILPAEQRRPRRRAYRIHTIRPRKHRPLTRQPVQARRRGKRRAVTPQTIGTLLVGRNNQYIRPHRHAHPPGSQLVRAPAACIVYQMIMVRPTAKGSVLRKKIVDNLVELPSTIRTVHPTPVRHYPVRWR